MSNQYVEEEISMIFSSDPTNGARNLSADGSSFEVQFDDGLRIPADAVNCSVSCEASSIWNSVPNIISNVNNKLYITGPNNASVPEITPYIITIPQGLYDLNDLNEAIIRELENAGAKNDPSPLISLSADDATQKVELKFHYSNVLVDFITAGTPREILGFDSGIYTVPTAPQTILAQNVAGFNTVNYFLLHSDITTKGLRFNNNYNQTIAQVLIDVRPGSLINYQPFNPPKIACPELIGTNRKNLRFWLTDDKNRLVNTNSEYYSLRVVIRYMRKI